MAKPLSPKGILKRQKQAIWKSLEAAGVRLDWAATETAGRVSNPRRVTLAWYPDGSCTVNLVDVPVELGQACLEAGLVRGTRW